MWNFGPHTRPEVSFVQDWIFIYFFYEGLLSTHTWKILLMVELKKKLTYICQISLVQTDYIIKILMAVKEL